MASSCSMVATTLISSSLSTVPLLALDDPKKLPSMVFSAAGIDDGHVGRLRGVLDRAVQTAVQTAVALPRAHRDPFSQNLGRRRDRNHHDIGIGTARGADHGMRHVG